MSVLEGVAGGFGGSFAATAPVPGNRLLSLLPVDTFARVAPHLDIVDLARKDVLFRPHEPLRVVYFPVTAVVSLVASLGSGSALEVGIVGRDGIAGTAVLPGITTMPCEGLVQIAGTAYQMDAAVLRREIAADPTLHAAIARYAHLLLARGMQLSLCNTFHPVEQRCIRWLLTVSDLIDGHEIPLTHDLLASTLGVRRPTVTVVFRSLQAAGLIDEKRGRLTLRDRSRMESACCECYQAGRQYFL